MTITLVTGATVAAALGCALMAGTFFAFSSFVMRALGALPTAQRISAMQAINVKVLNVSFLGTSLGTAALCAGLAVHAISAWGAPGSTPRLVGSVIYLVGSLGATLLGNVPRNEALATVAATGPDAADAWQAFHMPWMFWNHVRTAACLAALVAFVC